MNLKLGLQKALVGIDVLLGDEEEAKTEYLQRTMAYWTAVASGIHRRYLGRYGVSLDSNSVWDFYEVSDVLQDLLMRLPHAIKTHDARRGPLVPHVWHVLWRDCSYAIRQIRGVHFIDASVTDEVPNDWVPKFGNCVAKKLASVARTEEEIVVLRVLDECGAQEFDYQKVCEALPWWSETPRVQRKSFQRVVRSCAARLPSQLVERN